MFIEQECFGEGSHRTCIQEVVLDSVDNEVVGEQIANDIISLGEISESQVYTVNLVNEEGEEVELDVKLIDYINETIKAFKELNEQDDDLFGEGDNILAELEEMRGAK